ncbi:YncE family protein [Bacillus sp. SCS-151]|uniref:YncE family protein n=1 Tax=Nanhaiella sioensis TaxID=3115293 RepID=UPI003978B6E1
MCKREDVSGFSSVAAIDVKTHSLIATINVSDDPRGIFFTPDGKLAYVVCQDDGNVTVIDTKTHSVIATVSVGNRPNNIAIIPNGKNAYVVNQGEGSILGSLTVIDVFGC